MTETAQLTPSNGVELDSMGYSVSISNDVALAGAPGVIGYTLRQAVYAFLKPASGWKTTVQTAAVSQPSTYAQFGFSVSNIGSTIVVGAPGSAYTNYQGLVYVYGP